MTEDELQTAELGMADLPGDFLARAMANPDAGTAQILLNLAVPESEEGDALYIVVAGEIRARTKREGDVVFRSREVIGERSVLTQQPRSADCTTLTEVVALRIDKKDLWELMEEQPKITIQILKVIVDRYI